MKSPCRGWIAAFALLGACAGASALEEASPVEEVDFSAPLEEIRELIKPLESDSAEVKQQKARLRAYPDQLQQMIEQGQWSQFTSDSGLMRYNGTDLAIPGLAEKLTNLSALVKKEQAAREQAQIEQAESLLARVGEELKAAKKAEDLDDLLTELSRYRNDGYSNPPRLAALQRSLQSALQVAGNWQEYLIAEEAGDFRSSRNSLQQISSQLASNPILPRSHVLRLLNPAPQNRAGADGGAAEEQAPRLEAIIARLAETGDSATALAELKAMPRTMLADSSGADFLRVVESIETLRRLEPTMTEGEVFANVRNATSNSQQGRFTFNLAIDQISLNAIARNHGIATPSAKSTSARNALEGIALKARDQRNWPALRKVIHSFDQLAGNSYNNDSVKRSYDLKIIALLELGEAAAAREDLQAAASALFEATGIDGYYLQREVAYERLADLKKSDPAKVEAIIAKAEENRRRAEAERHAAEIEARSRVSMNRGFPWENKSDQEMTVLRSVVREVVAEFLKEKRTVPQAPETGDGKPAGPAKGSTKEAGQPEGGAR